MMNVLQEAKTVILYVSFLLLELAVIGLGWYLLFRYYLIEKFDFAKELFGLKKPPVYEPSAQFTARKKEKERMEKEKEKVKEKNERKDATDQISTEKKTANEAIDGSPARFEDSPSTAASNNQFQDSSSLKVKAD